MMAGDKKAKDSKSGAVLGPTYEPGKPDAPLRWQQRLRTREDALKYLQNGLRYWYGKGHGSERRKTEA